MRLVIRLSILATLIARSPAIVAGVARPDSAGQSTSTVTIQSVPESAYVTFDGRGVGRTPITMDSVTAGVHAVTLQHPDLESWLTEPVSDSVRLEAGETRVLRYNLPEQHFVTSTPFGAEVLAGDSIIGTTPMVIPPGFAQQPIALRKQGYEAVDIRFSDSRIISVPLKKIWQNDGNGDIYFKQAGVNNSKQMELYLSGAATVLSGVAAAYFKVKADDRYGQYLRNGDAKLLSQTNRLDRAAGIAIAATQIGLGLFTYFILSR